ncbi:MAG: hypothetical protein FWD17_00640 [Polyangiaceae bacterium]|nr:hypothetical protein [Polyangiaceae bacterium]
MRHASAALAVGAFTAVAACQWIDPIADVVLYDCRACASAQCAEQWSACMASTACQALEDCPAGCADAACRSACTTNDKLSAHADLATGMRMPIGPDVQLAAAVDVCVATNCQNECGPPGAGGPGALSCGGLSRIAPPDAASACAACLSQNDCPSATACGQSVNCQEYFLCRTNCSTGDCVGQCSEVNGDNPFFDFFTAVRKTCPDECKAGANWACVGSVQWPWTVGSASRPVRLTDLTSLEDGPVTGATVSLCQTDDPTCATPVGDTAQVASDGSVDLVDTTATLPPNYYGLNGFLAVRSGSPSTATSNVYPTNIFWGFPLSGGVIATPIYAPTAEEWASAGWASLASPDLGLVIASAVDCFGEAATGVQFALEGPNEPAPIYLTGLMAPAIALGVGPTTTAAIFPNVAPGLVDVVAIPPGFDRPVSRVSMQVQAGVLTGVILSPEPDAALGADD